MKGRQMSRKWSAKQRNGQTQARQPNKLMVEGGDRARRQINKGLKQQRQPRQNRLKTCFIFNL